MAIRKPAIVMALYDIGRDNWDAFNLSYNTYLAWMKNTLAIDACFLSGLRQIKTGDLPA